jgi:hypothetical protein
LIDANEFPHLTGLLGYPLTPIRHCFILIFGSFLLAALGFYNPIDFTLGRLMYDHPIGMIEVDSPDLLEIIDPKLRTRFAQVSRAESGKAGDILGHVQERHVQERGKGPLEVVIGGDVIEDGLFTFQRLRPGMGER